MNQSRKKDDTINKLSNLSWQRKLNERNSPPKGPKKKENISKPLVKNIQPKNCTGLEKTPAIGPPKNTNAVIVKKEDGNNVKSFQNRRSLNAKADIFIPNESNSNRDIKRQNYNQKKAYNDFDTDEKENFADAKRNSARSNCQNNSNFKSPIYETSNHGQQFNSGKFNASKHPPDNYRPSFNKNLQPNQNDSSSSKLNESLNRNTIVYEKIFNDRRPRQKTSQELDFTRNTVEKKRSNTSVQNENIKQTEKPVERDYLAENRTQGYGYNESQNIQPLPSSSPIYFSNEAISNPNLQLDNFQPVIQGGLISKRTFSNQSSVEQEFTVEMPRNEDLNPNQSSSNNNFSNDFESSSEIIHQINNHNLNILPQYQHFPLAEIKDIGDPNRYSNFHNELSKNQNNFNTNYPWNSSHPSGFVTEGQTKGRFLPVNQSQRFDSTVMSQNYSGTQSDINRFTYLDKSKNFDALTNFSSTENYHENNVRNFSPMENLENFGVPLNHNCNLSSMEGSGNFNTSTNLENNTLGTASINQMENFGSPLNAQHIGYNTSSMEKSANFSLPVNHRANDSDFLSMNKMDDFIASVRSFSSIEKVRNFNETMNIRNNAGDFPSLSLFENVGSTVSNELNTRHFSSIEKSRNFNEAVNFQNNTDDCSYANNLKNFDVLSSLQNDYNTLSLMDDLAALDLNDVSSNNFVIRNNTYDFPPPDNWKNFASGVANENYSLVEPKTSDVSSTNELSNHNISSVNTMENQNRQIGENKSKEETRTFIFNGRVIKIPQVNDDKPNRPNDGPSDSAPTTSDLNNLSNFDKFNNTGDNLNQQFTNILQIASVSLNQSEPFNAEISRQQISNVMQIANLSVNENEENRVKRTNASIISRTVIDNKTDQFACKIRQKPRVNIMKDYHRKRTADAANNVESDDMHSKYVTLAQQLCQAKNYDTAKSARTRSVDGETCNAVKQDAALGENSGHFNVALYKHVQSKRITNQDNRYFDHQNKTIESSGYETQISEDNFVQQMNARNSADLYCRQYADEKNVQRFDNGSFDDGNFRPDFHVSVKPPAEVVESRESRDVNRNINDDTTRTENIRAQYSTSVPKAQPYASLAVTRPRKNIGSMSSRRLFDNQVQLTKSTHKPNSMTISVKDDCFINFNQKATRNYESRNRGTSTPTISKPPSAGILKKTTKYFERRFPSSESCIQFWKPPESNDHNDEPRTPSKDDSSCSSKKVSFSPKLLEEFV